MKRGRVDGIISNSVRCSRLRPRARLNTRLNPRLGMNGNGCDGSIACGVSTGRICSRKWSASHSASRAVSWSAVTTCRPCSAKCLAKHHPFGLLRHDQGIGLRRDRVELLGRGAAVDRQILDPAQLLAFQAGHAGHEEFVDVGSGDGQEAQPLEQGMRHVGRFLQHPPIERQPRQFAVEIAIGGGRRAGSCGPALVDDPGQSPSARRMVGRVSRARSAKAWRSIASTTRSAVT